MSLKLLTNLNFAEKINNKEAVTEAGRDMLKNYRGYLYSNPVTCGVVNNFVTEAQKFSFDAGLNSILESVLSFISENKISWKLATACEGINNNTSTYGYIAKLGVSQVQKLLEMNEADVVSYIKAGCLKNVQYIPEFRAICKEIYKTTVSEVKTPAYVISTPASYVLTEANSQTFNVLGKSYEISEGKVSEVECKDTKFNRINNLLESFKTEDNCLVYEFKDYKFGLDSSDNTITVARNNNQKTFTTVNEFREYSDTISRGMITNEKLQFLNVTSAIADVYESIDNIVLLDNVRVLQTSNGTVCAIVEGQENVNLTVFRSFNSGASSKNYEYVIEALNDINKMTGIDLKGMYETRINEDAKKSNPDDVKEIQEQLDANKAAQMDIRKKKITMLAEAYKNDPVKIAILNKMAKELQILEDK